MFSSTDPGSRRALFQDPRNPASQIGGAIGRFETPSDMMARAIDPMTAKTSIQDGKT
jgi:hypothetical protein